MILDLLGGIGLFLLGMILLTDGLKAVAGDALRRVLSRFVRGPFSALLSGATVTMLVQSSSATTLTTIGFVSAGLLTFPQAVGVLFGANLGTTSTGWIVAVLGLKISVGKLALPLIGIGALLRLLTRDRLAAGGLALAGFGLIFVGIDTLQAGMAHLAERFDPSQLPGETFSGRLLLVAMGIAMTVVMQSSSAAVATTLTALHGGAIDLTQAAALVVGQNVGTTVTAGLACIGAATAAKRTALAHILFNVITGVVALAILPHFVRLADALAHGLEAQPGALALATFHTVFNVLGVLLLLPWTRGYARLIERLVPERGPALTRRLDATVATVAPVAIEATRLTLREIALVLSEYLQNLLQGRPSRDTLEPAGRALDETRKFLGRIRSDPETKSEHQRHIDTLHARIISSACWKPVVTRSRCNGWSVMLFLPRPAAVYPKDWPRSRRGSAATKCRRRLAIWQHSHAHWRKHERRIASPFWKRRPRAAPMPEILWRGWKRCVGSIAWVITRGAPFIILPTVMKMSRACPRAWRKPSRRLEA
ncbi:MAG: hypothetical protein DKINENOH_00245 [bacterium]|nr:hypothetical protein [bacterium]